MSNIHIWLMRLLLGGLRAEYFIKTINIRSLRSLYYFAMKQNNDNESIIYYEFGVGNRTLSNYMNALNVFSKDNKKSMDKHQLVLFDSFKGLPEPKDKKDINKIWKKGDFKTSMSKIFDITSKFIKLNQIEIFKGLFEDTLDYTLSNYLSHKKPDIITIDVDYYSSAKTILNFLRPLLKNGTIFYFDDVYAFYGSPKMGELAAIKEFNNEGKGYISHYPLISPNNCYVYSEY